MYAQAREYTYRFVNNLSVGYIYDKQNQLNASQDRLFTFLLQLQYSLNVNKVFGLKWPSI